jgi:hypothetical protein
MGSEPVQMRLGVEGGKIFAIVTHNKIKEELKPNLDQVIDNTQVELVVFVKLVVSIVEPTQPVVVAAKSS